MSDYYTKEQADQIHNELRGAVTTEIQALQNVINEQMKGLATKEDTKEIINFLRGYKLGVGIFKISFHTIVTMGGFLAALAVNTARQASTTQDADVIGSVDITTTLSLTGGTAGKVSLQYADNNTFTTNLVTVSEGTTSNTGTLTIGLALSQIGTAIVKGIIPANKYYRLSTTNVTGTPTYGTPLVQEVLL